MNRTEKEIVVQDMHAAFTASSLIVLAHNKGLSVSEMNVLRQKSKAAGSSFKVAKNTLALLALKNTTHEALAPHFVGPTTVAYSQDPVAAAKVIAEFANTNKNIEIIVGSMSGKAISKNEVIALSKLPSLDELRSTLIGVLQAPASQIARVLKEPGTQIARVLSAHAAQSAA